MKRLALAAVLVVVVAAAATSRRRGATTSTAATGGADRSHLEPSQLDPAELDERQPFLAWAEASSNAQLEAMARALGFDRTGVDR